MLLIQNSMMPIKSQKAFDLALTHMPDMIHILSKVSMSNTKVPANTVRTINGNPTFMNRLNVIP
jgi:hypothetical protein